MSFPQRVRESVVSALKEFEQICLRFPESVFFLIVIASLGMAQNHDWITEKGGIMRWVYASLSMFPLGTTLSLLAPRWKIPARARIAVTLLIWVGDFLLLREYSDTRYFLYFHGFLTASLFVSVLAALSTTSLGSIDFWAKIKALLIWSFRGALVIGSIWAVMSLCLFSIDKLFEVPVRDTHYADVAILVLAWLSPLYLLAFFRLEPKQHPVEGSPFEAFFFLRCVPSLTATFLLVLFAYYFKLIFTWSLPKGILSPLALTGLGMGLVSYVLSYPWARGALESRSKHVLRSLLPALFFVNFSMGLSVYIRTQEYGITEQRYFLWVLFFWMNFVFVWALLKRRLPLRVLFPSIALLLLLVSKGPWSAPDVSRRSQIRALKKVLSDANLLNSQGLWEKPEKSQIQGIRDRIDASAAVQIQSIVDYLSWNHGGETMRPIMADPSGFSQYIVHNSMQVLEFLLDFGVPGKRATQPTQGKSSDDWYRGVEAIPIDRPSWVIHSYINTEAGKSSIDGEKFEYKYSRDTEQIIVKWENHGDYRLDVRPIICSGKLPMGDYQKRYWLLSQKPRIEFAPSSLRFDCENDNMDINMNGSLIISRD